MAAPMRLFALLWCLAAALVLGVGASAGAERPASHPSLVDAHLPPLIPAEAFFADQAAAWGYRVSPDGRRLAWIAYKDGQPTIHLRDLDGKAVRTVSADKPVYRVYWANDNRHLVFYWDDNGDENYHLMVADSQAPDAPPRDLTPMDGVTVWWHQSFYDDPVHMLVSINQRDPATHDLYRLNIESGALARVADNPGNGQGWVTDKEGTIIGRLRRLEDKRRGLEVLSGGRWRLLIDWRFDEVFRVLGHPPVGGDFLWALSNRGRDRVALVRIDLASGTERVVYGHPTVDVDRVWVDDRDYRPLRASAWPGYLEFKHFDEALGRDLAAFQQDGPANVWVNSHSRDKQTLTVKVETDRTAAAFYLFDRRTKAATLLSEAPIAKHRDALARTEPVAFASRDGLTLHGYLTLPQGVAPRNLPMVLRVHGGPWLRDKWGFFRIDQFLANRGYAVLSVNYRGSTGYGRAFAQGARRQFARKMHDDLIDGVNWAIDQGIADRHKIAIYGRSYGGYATMVGLTFTPEVFAAGVNVVGVTDLVMALETFPAYWRPWLELWLDYVGDPNDPADRADMAARSPINFIERIQRPLLMVHGAKDVRVVRAHSDRIAEAMAEAGLPFQYIVFDNEGHAIRRWRNRLVVAEAMEQFLAEHLGGRAAGP
ncbi:MAG: S9 family peptidase [Pseudomonadota bacterium]